MNRKQITVNNFIKELQKTGTLNYIYRGTFTDDLQQSTWYEKVSRSPYIYRKDDIKEWFAYQIALILGVDNVEVMLAKDRAQEFYINVSLTRSFTSEHERYVEANDFFPQQRVFSRESLRNVGSNTLYEIVTCESNDSRYLISHNIEDLEYFDMSVRSSLEEEKIKLQMNGNVEKMMQKLYGIYLQDFLLGNADRSARNWGIIANQQTKKLD